MADVGVERGAAYLVRPDGYIGLADPQADAATLVAYLDAQRLRPEVSAVPTVQA